MSFIGYFCLIAIILIVAFIILRKLGYIKVVNISDYGGMEEFKNASLKADQAYKKCFASLIGSLFLVYKDMKQKSKEYDDKDIPEDKELSEEEQDIFINGLMLDYGTQLVMQILKISCDKLVETGEFKSYDLSGDNVVLIDKYDNKITLKKSN